MNNLLRSIMVLCCLGNMLLLTAQESCYEKYMREHNMVMPTIDADDDSYDELKKEVIARQIMREEAAKAQHAAEATYRQPQPAQAEALLQPLLLAIDTVTGTCHLITEDGRILAEAHLALVDSTWYMWLSVDPLADKYPANTPYLYCNGNPIMMIDPDGRKVVYNDETGACESVVNDFCSQSDMFNAVYKQLVESEKTYTFQFGKTTKNVDGEFASSKEGGVISLNRGGAWSSAIPEETFHALQTDNKGKYDNTLLNREFEAKVFVIMSGLPTGSYYGMDESYHSSLLTMDISNFTQPQSITEYIKQANIYSTYTKKNAIGNEHYWVPTTILPYNLISIIDRLK